MKWIVLFFWVELILLFSCGCVTHRDERGVDWMKWYDEERAFKHEPINWSMRRSPWYRNYHTMEEIREMWKDAMRQIKDKEEING